MGPLVTMLKSAGLAYVFLWQLGLGQQTTSMQQGSTTTSGIVEAVMENGDLKPARFAHVVAMPTERSGNFKAAVGALSKGVDDARATALKSIVPGPAGNVVETQCVLALMQIESSFIALRQSANDDPDKALVFSDADELGEFKLDGLAKRPYTILAIGKIGMNDALWLMDLEPSEKSGQLKMVRPQLACSDPNGSYKP
jgi:hypothetical protein